MSRQDPYLYKDVPVLKNLPGIKNSEELKRVEGDLTRMSMGIVYAREYEKFNTETLCDIHRTIFGGLYEWAGEFRTIPIMKAEEVLGGDTVRYAHVDDMDDQGALLVTLADGSKETVFSGEASVRGMYGYI